MMVGDVWWCCTVLRWEGLSGTSMVALAAGITQELQVIPRRAASCVACMDTIIETYRRGGALS